MCMTSSPVSVMTGIDSQLSPATTCSDAMLGCSKRWFCAAAVPCVVMARQVAVQSEAMMCFIGCVLEIELQTQVHHSAREIVGHGILMIGNVGYPIV